MKTSHILFASTVLLATFSTIFTIAIGSARMTHENQPDNTLSRLWMERYDLKVKHELRQPAKCLKVIGDNNISNAYITIHKNEHPSLFSMSPQNLTHIVKDDTLFLYTTGHYSDIQLRQSAPIEQVTLCHGNATIVGINQDQLTIDVQKDSRLNIGNHWSNRDNVDSISHLHLHATDRSNVDLRRLKMKTATVNLENAVLNYEANVEVDSLWVTLKNRSTVASLNKDVINQINHLFVSGDKQYFTKEFAGKDVNVSILP